MIVDTGPLIAAISRRDHNHRLAAGRLRAARRNALVPDPVIVEVDLLARRRYGPASARQFLLAMTNGVHRRLRIDEADWKLAVEIDAQHADLDLGFVDATVMALAYRLQLPIFTFDFRDFRAIPTPDDRPWPLVVEESDLGEAGGSGL